MSRSNRLKLLLATVVAATIIGSTTLPAAGAVKRSATINTIVTTPTGYKVTYTGQLEEVRRVNGNTVLVGSCKSTVINGNIAYDEPLLFCGVRDPATEYWDTFTDVDWEEATWTTRSGVMFMYEADWVFCMYLLFRSPLPSTGYTHTAPEVCVPLISNDRNLNLPTPK